MPPVDGTTLYPSLPMDQLLGCADPLMPSSTNRSALPYCKRVNAGLRAHRPDLDPIRPPPISWPDYESWLAAEWTALLDKDPPEVEVQAFLEQNPSLLPGTGGYRGGTHGPYGIVFAESDLQGIGGNFKPDFMWITANSIKVHPVMIEIEAPGRRYFTKAGDFTSEFNHAHRQLLDWKMWWNYPENISSFTRRFLDPIWDFRDRKIEPRYILIYGRSHERVGDSTLNRRRAEAAHPDEEIMTFDRLSPSEYLCDIASVQRTSARARLRAVPSSFTTGPPTMKFAPWLDPPELDTFTGVPLWDRSRAEYVHARFRHWQEIGKSESRSIQELQCGE